MGGGKKLYSLFSFVVLVPHGTVWVSINGGVKLFWTMSIIMCFVLATGFKLIIDRANNTLER